jgi:hypothetical protein
VIDGGGKCSVVSGSGLYWVFLEGFSVLVGADSQCHVLFSQIRGIGSSSSRMLRLFKVFCFVWPIRFGFFRFDSTVCSFAGSTVGQAKQRFYGVREISSRPRGFGWDVVPIAKVA